MENSCYGCLGYAYIPIQESDKINDPCKALETGTLFPELELTICDYGKICKGKGGLN